MPEVPPSLRIFPLGAVVLFPNVSVPLRIFEPRYRAMLSDALAGDRTIGMVLARDCAQREPVLVHEVGCAGRIVAHEPLEDGRSLIVLHGTGRFRIRCEQESGHPYRVVEVQSLYEVPILAHRMRPLRNRLRRCVERYLASSEGSRAAETSEAALAQLLGKTDLESAVNRLSVALPLEALDRQSLLEAIGGEQRCDRLIELLEFRMASERLGLDPDRGSSA